MTASGGAPGVTHRHAGGLAGSQWRRVQGRAPRPGSWRKGNRQGWPGPCTRMPVSCAPHPPRVGVPEVQEGLPLPCPLVLEPSGSQAGGSLPGRHFPETSPALLCVSRKIIPALRVRKPELGWLIVGSCGLGVRTRLGSVPELTAGPTLPWGSPYLNSHFRRHSESVTERALGRGPGGRAALGILLWPQQTWCRAP